MDSRSMRWVLTKYGCAVSLAIVLLGGYFAVGHCVPARDGSAVLLLPVDRAIPYVPATGWIYLLGLVGSVLGSTLAIQDRELFRLAAWAVVVSACLNFTFYVALPISYPRPLVDALGHVMGPVPYAVAHVAGDAWSPQLMAWLYSFDPPACTYPSFHVTYPVSFALAARYHSRRAAVSLAVTALALLVATWTTKQHFFVDGFAGALSAWFGHRIAFHRWRVQQVRRARSAVGSLPPHNPTH
jgi:hypothetical protein